MNVNILTEKEINQKLYVFQKAVEAYVMEKTIKNAQAVAEAKASITRIIGG